MAHTDNQLKEFRQWIHEQKPILNSIDTDEFLSRFLHVTNENLSQAKDGLIRFWKYRTENPQWFTDRDLLKNPLMIEIADLGYCLQLPKETNDGLLIFLMRAGQYDPNRYSLDDVTKYAFAVTDILNSQPKAQTNGFIIILDFTNIKLQHIRQFTPDLTRRYSDCWEKLYPVHLRQIHFYNYAKMFDPVLCLFRMFLSKDLKDRIHFHAKSSTSSKSLHKFIDPEFLPIEYDGQLGSIEGELNKNFLQWVQKRNDYMIQFDQYGIDLKCLGDIRK